MERMSKKRCLRMESLPYDVEKRILERLPVKSLLRFKAVSKLWKSTIESRFFHEKHLKQHQQSEDPEVLMVGSLSSETADIDPLRTLVLGSPSSVKIPTPWDKDDTDHYLAAYNSCDGLVCLYHYLKPGFIVNPTTRWYRSLPLCQFQQLVINLGSSYCELGHAGPKIGFGKDTFTGTCKPVWLYNSLEIGLENITTCEVFDFTINAWRYVTPSAPYRVLRWTHPVFVDGSLHWFTDCEDTKILSFDLHTEAFQVLAKAPFANPDPHEIVMCNLDNRLCVSELKWPYQMIWSFNSDNKTWDKIRSIYVDLTYLFNGVPTFFALYPLALLNEEKNNKKKTRLLYYNFLHSKQLFIHEPETSIDNDVFRAVSVGYPICYFPSLISI